MSLILGRCIVVILAFIGFMFLLSLFFSFFVPWSKFYSNGDAIRGMSNKELARFLSSGNIVPCRHCREWVCNECDVCERKHAESQFLDWLKSDFEEGIYD